MRPPAPLLLAVLAFTALAAAQVHPAGAQEYYYGDVHVTLRVAGDGWSPSFIYDPARGETCEVARAVLSGRMLFPGGEALTSDGWVTLPGDTYRLWGSATAVRCPASTGSWGHLLPTMVWLHGESTGARARIETTGPRPPMTAMNLDVPVRVDPAGAVVVDAAGGEPRVEVPVGTPVIFRTGIAVTGGWEGYSFSVVVDGRPADAKAILWDPGTGHVYLALLEPLEPGTHEIELAVKVKGEEALEYRASLTVDAGGGEGEDSGSETLTLAAAAGAALLGLALLARRSGSWGA